MYDVFIKNGLLADGSGSKAYNANVGIIGDKIVYIGSEISPAKRVIDASGKMVAPGFIDAHSHGDVSLGSEYAGLAKLSQGITTEIAGQCGSSLFPIAKKNQDVLKRTFGVLIQKDDLENLDKFAKADDYKKHMNAKKLLLNTAQFVGHSTIRLSAMGFDNRKATTEEMNEMKSMLRDAMENGAMGMSSGLIYPPGAYAPNEEMVELCKLVKEYGGIYVTHIRNESDLVEDAVKETLEIAKESGVRLWISHHKSMGVKNNGKVKKTLKMMEEYREQGLEISYDIYPYTASRSNGYNMIAPRYLSQGADVLAEKLKEKEFRAEIKKDMLDPEIPYDSYYLNAGSFENVLLSVCHVTKELAGMSIAEYAQREGIEDPFEAFFDIMVANKGTISCCYKSISLDDIDFLIQKDFATLGTDSMILTPDAPVHPRSFGTFTYGFKRFVNEKKFFTPEEMVHKLTKFTAEKFNLEGRGELKEGHFADVIVIDVENIDGLADYVNSNALSNGIEQVIINGQLVYENKELTENRAGMLLM